MNRHLSQPHSSLESDVFANINRESVSVKEPWLFCLGEEYIPCEKGTVDHDVALILKDMLLSNDSDYAAPMAVRQLHTYYCNRNLESSSLFRYQKEKEGFFDFLNFLYHLIIWVALYTSYHDSRYDFLVQLVVELYRLPPGPDTAWNGGRLVIPGEPMFVNLLGSAWGENFGTDTKEQKISSSEFKQECEKWVKLSSFIARCANARVDDHLPDIAKYSSIDIPEGLGKDIPFDIERDTRVIIATQHILFAGCVIEEELVQGGSLSLDKWQLWAEKLKELAEKQLALTVKTAVIEARKKLISIHAELFPTSEEETSLIFDFMKV